MSCMIKPKRLEQGDHVALIAPSSPVSEEKLEMSVESVRFLGLIPVLYPSCTMKHGYLSGSDEVRAQDVNAAFADSNMDAVFCLRGGYGMTRILSRIDYENIRKNPKLLIGYSDITGLHLAVNRFCDMTTLHSPMPTRGWNTLDAVSLKSLTDNLFSGEPTGPAPAIEGETIEIIQPGIAEGQIIGGNLSLLAATLGTPFEINAKNKIIFIEDVEEKNYRIDRGLTSLALAGKFDDCAGIILGTWADCGDPELPPEDNLTLRQIFDEVVKPYGKPVINNFRAGHIYPQISIPMGTNVILDALKGSVTFTEALTR